MGATGFCPAPRQEERTEPERALEGDAVASRLTAEFEGSSGTRGHTDTLPGEYLAFESESGSVGKMAVVRREPEDSDTLSLPRELAPTVPVFEGFGSTSIPSAPCAPSTPPRAPLETAPLSTSGSAFSTQARLRAPIPMPQLPPEPPRRRRAVALALVVPMLGVLAFVAMRYAPLREARWTRMARLFPPAQSVSLSPSAPAQHEAETSFSPMAAPGGQFGARPSDGPPGAPDAPAVAPQVTRPPDAPTPSPTVES